MPELLDRIIVALASVVLHGACQTHIYPVYFWVLFDDYEAITTLSRGRAALRWENGRSPWKAPPGPRPSASEGRRSVAIVAGPCGAHKLAIHTPRFRCFSSVVRCSELILFTNGAGCALTAANVPFSFARIVVNQLVSKVACSAMVLIFLLPRSVSCAAARLSASFVCEQIVYSSLAYFCSGERCFLSLRRRNHLVDGVDWRVSHCGFP